MNKQQAKNRVDQLLVLAESSETMAIFSDDLTAERLNGSAKMARQEAYRIMNEIDPVKVDQNLSDGELLAQLGL